MVAEVGVVVEEEEAGQVVQGGVGGVAAHGDEPLHNGLKHRVLLVPSEGEPGDRGEEVDVLGVEGFAGGLQVDGEDALDVGHHLEVGEPLGSLPDQGLAHKKCYTR